jgi:hypothetical protein
MKLRINSMNPKRKCKIKEKKSIIIRKGIKVNEVQPTGHFSDFNHCPNFNFLVVKSRKLAY